MFKFGNHAKKTVDPLKAYRDPTVPSIGKPVVASVHSTTQATKKKISITADIATDAGGNYGPGMSGTYNSSGVSGYNHDQYNTVWDKLDEGSVIEGWIPRDAAGLDALYNRIYLRDPTLGAGIDLLKNLPWSDYNLEGIKDPEVKRIYEDCMDSLHVPLLMPEVTGEYLIKGRDISSLAFDERKGIFSGVLPHDPDFIKITPIQIYGYDPICDLKLTPGFKKFLTSTDPRMIEARKTLPTAFVNAARNDDGFLPLDPNSTIYLGRAASKTDYVGTSILTRALYFWGIEKALLNAQLISTRRRSRSFTHVKAGVDGVWEPQAEEMDALAAMFMQANEDPVGAIITTRNGVEVSEPLGSGQDFYKWSDEIDLFSKFKMQILGMSEALLSGDATYANADSARTVFVELLANLRFRITQKFFYMKLFPTLARLHGFVKRSEAELSHNIRVGSTVTASLPAWAQTSSRVMSSRMSARDRMSTPTNQLIMPTIEWHKQLRPALDMDAFNILDQLKSGGYPVTIAKWASAAGYGVDNLEEELKEDQKVRNLIKKYEDTPVEDMGSEDTSAEDNAEFEDAFSDGTEEAAPASVRQSLTAQAKAIKSGIASKANDLGIWKMGRCKDLSMSEAERVVASIAKTSNPAIFKDGTELMHKLKSHYKGNESKAYITAYILNRLGLTNVGIPTKYAGHIVAGAQEALAASKSFNSDKFLISLAKFEKEMKCIHHYAGGRLPMAGIKEALEKSKSLSSELGNKELSGLY